MNENVFLAVAAMDAYNRARVSATKLAIPTNRIGNATVVSIGESAADGFVGVSYLLTDYIGTLGAGTTVIAYRGTDGFADVLSAWPGIIGDPYTAQASDAVAFYHEVKAGAPGGIIMTGHSLGGALAGLVASLAFEQAVLFANIAFELAATNTYNGALANDNVYNSLLRTRFYGDQEPWQPNFSGIRGIAISGEVAEITRLGQSTPVDTLDFVSPFNAGAVNLHSMALHVLLTYADANQSSMRSWIGAADPLYRALTLKEISGHAGVASLAGFGGDAEKLTIAIAYSALDEGERPFGDTAIRALFDDTADLAAALATQHLPASVEDAANILAEIFVEYSALLAVNKILDVDRPLAREGVLSMAASGSAITVDISDQSWTFGGEKHKPLHIEELINNALNNGGNASALISAALHWYAGETGQGGSNIYQLVKALSYQLTAGSPDELTFLEGQDLAMFVLTSFPGSLQQLTSTGAFRGFFVGTSGAESVNAGDGIDILIGNAGDDLLQGGGGNDWLNGGTGNDDIWGGTFGADDGRDDGRDTVDYSVAGGPIVVTFGSSAGISVDDGQGGTDTLHSIEIIKGSNQADILKLTDLNGADDIDYIDLGGGDDTLDISGLGAAVTVDLRDQEDVTVQLSGGGPVLHLKHVEHVIGGSADDTIRAWGGQAVTISGGGGYNVLELSSYAGTRVDGSSGTVLIRAALTFGFDGFQKVVGSDAPNIMFAAPGDHFVGGGGPNYIEGSGQGTKLESAAGDTYFSVRNGATVISGAGNDYIEVEGTQPVTIVFGRGSGHDVLGSHYPGYATNEDDPYMVSSVDYDHAWAMPSWTAERGNDTILFQGFGPGDLELLWDYQEYEPEETRIGYAVIRIKGTGDTLALGVIITGRNTVTDDFYMLVDWDREGGSSGAIYDFAGKDDDSDEYGNTIDLKLFSFGGEKLSLLDIFDLRSIGPTALDPSYYAAKGLLSGVSWSSGDPGDGAAIGGTGDADILTGGNGPDDVLGGAGNDRLSGGAGDDFVRGGTGDDIVFAGPGDDNEDGGDGRDTIDYGFTAAGVIVNLATGAASGAEIGNDRVTSFESATGGAGADQLIGDDGDNALVGGAGSDRLVGAAGADILDGGT
ncbi:MAG: hypothetical protein ABIW83_06985, partial [Allosphingosinicella sp.]